MKTIRLSIYSLFTAFFALSSFSSAYAGEVFLSENSSSLWSLLSNGIEINIIQGILLTISMYFFARLMLMTRRRYTMPLELISMIKDEVGAGRIESAIIHATENNSLFAKITLPGLKLHNHSHAMIVAAMEGKGRRLIGSLKQKGSYMAHIGIVAPMLGFLGTILGMMHAYTALGMEGTSTARVIYMSQGIGEALATSAVGLIVSIPSLAGYYFSLTRIGRLGNELESLAEEISATLAENNTNGGK